MDMGLGCFDVIDRFCIRFCVLASGSHEGSAIDTHCCPSTDRRLLSGGEGTTFLLVFWPVVALALSRAIVARAAIAATLQRSIIRARMVLAMKAERSFDLIGHVDIDTTDWEH